MKFTEHFLFGVIFASLVLFLFPGLGLIGFFIIILSTVLIDVDHYIVYIFKKKSFNLRKSYSWFINKQKKLSALPREQRNLSYITLCFFHNIELLIILFLLGFFSKHFFYVFLGFAFHLLLDIIHQSIFWNRLDRVSLIYDFIKYKRLGKL